MTRIYYFATALVLALTLSSCKTQDNPNNPSGEKLETGSIDAAAMAKSIWNARVETKNLTANLGVTLKFGSKEISCDGKLRMKRDDVVQLSLTLPLLGTEVGRLECTPDEVLLVDRINRQYCRAKYSDVGFLAKAGLDFYSLQAVLWNEIFVPGETSPKNSLGRFRASASGGHVLLSLTDTPTLEYDFLAFTNTSVNAQDRLDDDRLLMGYPAFSGEKIYMAGLSTGVVQISSREDRGYLVYDRSRLAADDLTLVVSAKKHSSDTSGTWGLSVAQLDDGGTTNSLALLDLDYEFPSSPFIVPLPNCGTPCRLLLLPSDSAKGNRRILIDHLAFVRGYSPEAVETNVVKTAFVTDSTTYSVRGLCPQTEYITRITAFAADGNESDSSKPLLVSTTGTELPFTVRIR